MVSLEFKQGLTSTTFVNNKKHVFSESRNCKKNVVPDTY